MTKWERAEIKESIFDNLLVMFTMGLLIAANDNWLRYGAGFIFFVVLGLIGYKLYRLTRED